MKSLRSLIPLLAILPFVALAAPASRTVYALSGIVSTDPASRGAKLARSSATVEKLDDASALASIGPARLLYSTDGTLLRVVLEARNRLQLPTPVIVYMGGFTTNGDDVIALERDFRTGIAMTPVARLPADLNATATTFNLTEPAGGELAVKASTVDASDTKDATKFCFWLRIDDELMKVTAAAATGRITVARGFAGTTAAPHRAGQSALSPVYVGNRDQLGAARHTNSWPGGPDYLRYALDPRQPAAARFKGGIVTRFMRAGYDGAWFDTFQPIPYNLCDALGRPVNYFWDFADGRAYDFHSYLGAIKTYVRNVRGVVHSATGREPILYANSATRSYAMGLKALFNHDGVRDLLDGYCFEDSYLKVQASRAKGKSNAAEAAFVPLTGEKWVTNATNHADAARSGLTAICMAGPAGYLAAHINSTQPNYETLIRYAYGSYLLTVTKERTTSFGLPLLVGPSKITAWPTLLYVPLGDPLQPNDLAALKLPDSPCYARAFEHGWVAVNPSAGGNPVKVTAPAGCVDAVTKLPIKTVSIAAGDAIVLLQSKP